jgi:hypothetical protein
MYVRLACKRTTTKLRKGLSFGQKELWGLLRGLFGVFFAALWLASNAQCQELGESQCNWQFKQTEMSGHYARVFRKISQLSSGLQ